MTSTLDELEYLDNILVYLHKCPPSGATEKQIFTTIYGEPFTEDGDTVAEILQIGDGYFIDYSVSNFYKMGRLQRAIQYLKGENLVTINEGLPNYTLTYEGRLKATNGYVLTFEKNESDRKLQNQLIGDQIKEISKSRNRSWWAIGISLLAAAGALWQVYNDYTHNDAKSNQNTTHTEDSILPCVKEPSKLQR